MRLPVEVLTDVTLIELINCFHQLLTETTELRQTAGEGKRNIWKLLDATLLKTISQF
jgi:hypothetical protein